MSSTRRLHRPAAPWLRVPAAVCAGLVGLLSIATSSPAVHAWLHGEYLESDHSHVCSAPAHETEHTEEDEPGLTLEDHAASHDCAITLFAHGVTLVHAFLAALDQPRAVLAFRSESPERVALSESRHLRPQPQAPPVG
jgi:hypothetical protein